MKVLVLVALVAFFAMIFGAIGWLAGRVGPPRKAGEEGNCAASGTYFEGP